MYISPTLMEKAVEAAKTMSPDETVVEIPVGSACVYLSRDKAKVDLIFTRIVLGTNPNDQGFKGDKNNLLIILRKILMQCTK